MIVFRDVHKRLGGEVVLGGISFELPRGGIYCLTGPSGCGKTTTLRLMAGLERPDRGEVIMPAGNRLSYSFQEPRLLPWKTAEENVAFVLRDVMPGRCCRDTAREYLELAGLWRYKDYYPGAMSGGMRQRLGLCRALAFPHDMLLLDEPFRSLDYPLKMKLLGDLVRIWKIAPRTVVCVTHDVSEAVLLGQRVLVFSGKPATVRGEVTVPGPPGEKRPGDGSLALPAEEVLSLLEADDMYCKPDGGKKT